MTGRKGLKMALVHPRFRPDGGAERAILHTLKALSGEARITVISRNRWPIAEEGVEWIRCNPFYMGRFWRKWSFIRSASRILRGLDVDFIQSQVRLPGCDVYRAGGGVHREWLNQRLLVSGPCKRLAIGSSPYHCYKLRMERRTMRHPALKAVICNSSMVQKEIRAHYGLALEKLRVVYNPVDHGAYNPESARVGRSETRRRLGVGEKDLLMLLVGTGFERKGAGLMIDVLTELPADFHLAVIGKDPKSSQYQRQARRRGAGARAHFLGVQSDVRPFYGAADVFVLPTLYDAFANTVLEAMACGLPVVTSDKCGAVDIIETGRNGFICDPLDRDAWRECLFGLRSPERRASIGVAGRATVSGLTAERMREDLLSIYREIIPQ